MSSAPREAMVPLTRWQYFTKTLYHNAAAKTRFVYNKVVYEKDETLQKIEEGNGRINMGLLLVLKIVFGIAAGLVLDVPLRRILPKGLYGGYEGHADEVDCHEEHEEHSSIFLAALRHTLEIFVFILVFSFIIGLIFGLVGADSAAAFLGSLGIFQPMMAALIGLVPNCGASVLLAQLYMGGAITFGSFFAGLCSGAGIGLAVLWRVNPSWKQNLFMTGLLWFCGTCCGILLQWVV